MWEAHALQARKQARTSAANQKPPCGRRTRGLLLRAPGSRVSAAPLREMPTGVAREAIAPRNVWMTSETFLRYRGAPRSTQGGVSLIGPSLSC